jgi:hypothetical protein
MYKYNTSQDQVSKSRTISATNLSILLEIMQISGSIDTFNEENSHANIPTEQCPIGEIRGQNIDLEIQMNTGVLYVGLQQGFYPNPLMRALFLLFWTNR